MKATHIRYAIGCALGLLSGCVSGPDYQPPRVEVPESWQTPTVGTIAEPTQWWKQFADPALTNLVVTSQLASPTLAQAAAAITKARAERGIAASDSWPTLQESTERTADGLLDRDGPASRSTTAQLDASWELDLFGKAQRSRESAAALLQAREAEYRGAQISLVAEVARNYIDYRACRLKQAYYAQQADSQATSSELTQLAAGAGFVPHADAMLGRATVASARATALEQSTACEVLVKALVTLTGIPEPSIRDLLKSDIATLPQPDGLLVSDVPADVLRQRPDVIAAERELASTNALIGVAEASRWPTLTLNGTVGMSSLPGSGTTSPWSFAPVLTLPIFDGQRISAGIRNARANYDAALANYQYAVRKAVGEVEQALVCLNSMAEREAQARDSVRGYQAYLTATEERWRAGAASLMDLETARRAAVAAEITLLELQQNRLTCWIALYKAMGGSWQIEQGKRV